MKRRNFLSTAAKLGLTPIVNPLNLKHLFNYSSDFKKHLSKDDIENDEVLYNGIRLPKMWPPRYMDPTSDEPMPVPYLKNPPEVIPIDIGRQLFVDDFLIHETNLQRTFHHPEKYSGNPVFKAETEEELNKESVVYLGHGGVFYDNIEKIFKMYYTSGWRGGLALATSYDMINWNRPKGPFIENLLLLPGERWQGYELRTAGTDNCIWLDLEANNSKERIKFLTCWFHVPVDQRPAGFNHSLHTSFDGLNWSKAIPTGMAADYCSFFYNPFRKVWVFSIKQNRVRGRCRYYSEHRDFKNGADWSNAVYWTNSDKLDKPEPENNYPGAGELPQLYSLNAVAYESIMIGMHYIHRGPNNQKCEIGQFPKLTDLEVGFSRDGFHWSRPDRTGFIIGSRFEGAWDRAYLHSTAGIFVVYKDQLVFPYTGYSGIGHDGKHGMYTGGSIGLAILRRDGFASMNTQHNNGLLLTRLVRFKGEYLFVNVDCPDGELRVEILDDSNKIIKPFSGKNCLSISVNKTLKVVKWKNAENLRTLKDKPVRFRFYLTNGKLYAFWVSSDKKGISNGYLGAGGPDYNFIKDTDGL